MKHEKTNPADWPLGDPQRAEPPKEKLFVRLSGSIKQRLARAVSNLRLSLSLRIALYYARQLLFTTLPAMIILMAVLCCAEIRPAEKAMDELVAIRPANGREYAQEQLLGLPFENAYLLEKTIAEGVAGIGEKLSLAFSQMQQNGETCIQLYVDTAVGGVVGAYRITHLVRQLQVLFWTFLLIDLYRVVFFLNRRDGLNRRVLRPVSEMAQQAARLSAANLSDRISVEGAKNELKDLAVVINDMLDRIEVSYNSQKQFVSDASHELRTPIAVIQGYVKMLKRWGKTDPDVLEEGISAIAQEADSMKELVERLLFLARHDKKTLMLEMESFDPLEVMSEVHREAQMLSSAHVFSLNPAQNARISGDKDMIKQLMRILLENAIKYTPLGGSITLGVKKDRQNCILTVSDTGKGISAEELPKVFDRFYRCDDTRKSHTSGHGLGLSIARIIVAAHGGKLKVRSKVGSGTTFSVLLPLDET